MSGLVTGLQNRAQRFESASDLQNSIANQLFCGWLAYFFDIVFISLKVSLLSGGDPLQQVCFLISHYSFGTNVRQ